MKRESIVHVPQNYLCIRKTNKKKRKLCEVFGGSKFVPLLLQSDEFRYGSLLRSFLALFCFNECARKKKGNIRRVHTSC